MKDHVYEGNCYMHHNRTDEDSYCPDYVNRRKENKECGMTLDEWIESQKGSGRVLVDERFEL
jgi:hypothetical protein